MSHTYHHAMSSVRLYGGKPEDYQKIHDWFDETKVSFADFRHRALRHHAEGIFECEKKFGVTITNSNGRQVPVRLIGEQHVKEDCGGFIPSVKDWLERMQPASWMSKGYTIPGLEPARKREFAAADLVAGAMRAGWDPTREPGIPKPESSGLRRLLRALPFLPG